VIALQKKIPLHIKIILALILGAIFGGFFPIDNNEYLATDESGNTYSLFFSDSLISSSHGQAITETDIIPLSGTDPITLSSPNNSEIVYQDIVKIEKDSSIATWIKPLGDLFINLLSFIAIPLVISSLIVGAASLESISKLGKIGGKAFLIYLSTTAIAIATGIGLANLFEPGTGIEKTSIAMSDKVMSLSEKSLDLDVIDFLIGIVPRNPFQAITSGEMLQIVFLAIIFGITLSLIDREKSAPVIKVFEGVSTAMIKMVDIIMLLAPYGVFALMAAIIASFGFEIIDTLAKYIFVVIFGLIIQTVLIYSLIVKFIGRYSLSRFFKGMANAQAVAFSTSSSAATLPVTIDTLENKLGIRKEITNFVLPLGATINMDGTALYQGVATIFIAQFYGIDLSMAEQFSIVFIAVLASIGTAPVPGVGIIMLVMILNSLGIPAEGIALIIGVDRVLDMCRTVTNVTGDASVAIAVAR